MTRTFTTKRTFQENMISLILRMKYERLHYHVIKILGLDWLKKFFYIFEKLFWTNKADFIIDKFYIEKLVFQF